MATSTVTCIVGLPGSGKTTFARYLQVCTYPEAVLIDDPSEEFPMRKLLEDNPTLNFIVVDPWLCDPQVRKHAQQMVDENKRKVEWIFFAHDPEACHNNDRRRGTKRTGDVNYFASVYQIPEGAPVQSVWKEENDE